MYELFSVYIGFARKNENSLLLKKSSKVAQCGDYRNILSLTFFWQKFREGNGFTKEITK